MESAGVPLQGGGGPFLVSDAHLLGQVPRLFMFTPCFYPRTLLNSSQTHQRAQQTNGEEGKAMVLGAMGQVPPEQEEEEFHWRQHLWSRLRTATSLLYHQGFRMRCGMACVLPHKFHQRLPSLQRRAWAVLRLGLRLRRQPRQRQGRCSTSRRFRWRKSRRQRCQSI